MRAFTALLFSIAMRLPTPIYLVVPLLAQTAWQAHTIGIEANNLSDDDWDSVVSQPNATGRVYVKGFDVTREYPSGPADWSLQVSVKANVPLPGGDDLPEDERFTTGTELGFKLPEGASDTFGSNSSAQGQTWLVCQSFYLLSRLAVEGEENDFRSDCAGALSISCRNALESQMRVTFIREIAGSGACNVPNVAECEGQLYLEDGEEGAFDFDGISGTSGFPLEKTDHGELVRFASGNHSADDTDDYDRAIRQIWVAGIVWGYRNESILNATDESDRIVQPNIYCVAATSTDGDSRGLEDGASGIRLGDGLGGSTAWVAMIVAAGFMAAMM